MTSILSGFDTVQQALAAQQFALSIAQRNVAHVNDPAYTRQDAVFNPVGEESQYGVAGVSARAYRDRFIDFSISRELQSLGENSVTYDALQQIDAIFGGNSGENLQTALSGFFNSLSALTSAPEDLALRQQVISRANNLAGEFRQIYAAVQQVQISQDRAIAYTVDEINAITAQIADCNKKILTAQQTHSESEFTLRDTRQQLLEQLAGLVDISYHETESGAVTVATKQGGLLVLEDQNRSLTATRLPGAVFLGVQLNGADITQTLESGKLGGLIRVRDEVIAGYLNALDDMAATIIARVNEQHAQGSDLDGSVGGDLFAPFVEIIPGSNTGAARSMSVALTDPRKIAAASLGAGVGDNTNAQNLATISEEPLLSANTATIHQFYARLVYDIGSEEKTAEEAMQTQNNLLEQLKNQRSASSGVNLDEEAINIVKYQKAYQASARMANVLDLLSEDILQLLGA